MKAFVLVCLAAMACHCNHSYYPPLYTESGAIHLGCDIPAQCQSQAKHECPWGYSILSHSNPKQNGYYSLIIKCR